jgi:ornithine cyclodeaminase
LTGAGRPASEGAAAPRIVHAAQLEQAIDLPRLIDEIADGFVAYSAGRVVVPPVGHLGFDEPPGDVHIKYGYVRGDSVYVVKIASGFERNVSKGLPPGDGMMLVFDRATGVAKAVLLDRGTLTDFRTAVAGAVVARALAPREIRRIGIIGAGVQGRVQLRCLAPVTTCREAMVFSRTPARAVEYARELGAAGFRVAVAPSADALAAECNLIVTATTARGALFAARSVRAGAHVSAFGADAPGKQELDPELFRRADVVVADSRAQAADHGDLAHAIASGAVEIGDVRELGEVLAAPALGRASDDQITVCDLTGVAVQDIAIAKHVLARLAEGLKS